MVNPFKEVNWHPDRAERRRFAVSLITGFPCVALIVLAAGYVMGDGGNVRLVLNVGGLGSVAGLVLLAWPAIARPFYVVWYAAACTIGLVLGNVLLAALFYLLVTGLGLVKRLVGSHPIRKTMDRQASTYWQDADRPSDPRQYYRQF